MRKFEKQEIFRHKCPICGSNNKKWVPTMYKHIPYGYALHCCNCGYVQQFITPSKSLGGLYNGQFSAGEESEQRCYALNKCTHTDCPLYGTYEPDKDSGYDDEQGDSSNGNRPSPEDPSGNEGNQSNQKPLHYGVYGSNFSDERELDVKVEIDTQIYYK